MASLRSIAWILLLLAALCSTVLALSSSVPNGQDDKIKVISMGDLDHGYSLLNQPAPLPVAVMPQQLSNNNAVASPDTVTMQSSASNFFNQNYNRIQVPLTWQRAISGGVLLAVGFVLGIYGFRFLSFSLLLTGFVGGGKKKRISMIPPRRCLFLVFPSFANCLETSNRFPFFFLPMAPFII